ncbi:MAG TPA: hypothetical protein VHK23_10725, partial [Miltoncostaeaceae bacterium]|nr:hypothetical protein [Miltoncostaeaceae bacterium]
EEVEAMIGRAAEMAEAVLADGMEAAVNRFHASPPGERARARRERREGPDEAEQGADGGGGDE